MHNASADQRTLGWFEWKIYDWYVSVAVRLFENESELCSSFYHGIERAQIMKNHAVHPASHNVYAIASMCSAGIF